MKYIFMPELSHRSGVSCSSLNSMCEQQKIDGAVRCGGIWAVPESAVLNVASLLSKVRV